MGEDVAGNRRASSANPQNLMRASTEHIHAYMTELSSYK